MTRSARRQLAAKEKKAKQKAIVTAVRGTPSIKEKRRLAVWNFYDLHDHAVAEMLKDETPSCKRGCAHCCKSPVMMSLAEAEAIIDRFPEVVARVRPKLEEHYVITDRLITEVNGRADLDEDRREVLFADRYWDEVGSCAFLENNECSVYEARPYPCRNYHVTSEPERCDGPAGTLVNIVYAVNPQRGMEVLGSMQPNGEVQVGFLPIITMYALRF